MNYKSCPLCRNIHIGSTDLNNTTILLFNCSICSDDTNNNICKLNCGHYFHKPCIDKWFNYKKIYYNNIVLNESDDDNTNNNTNNNNNNNNNDNDNNNNNEFYCIILFILLYIFIFIFMLCEI